MLNFFSYFHAKIKTKEIGKECLKGTSCVVLLLFCVLLGKCLKNLLKMFKILLFMSARVEDKKMF